MTMRIYTLLIVIAFRHLALITAANGVSQSGFYKTENNDHIFGNDVIMEVVTRSRLACANICEATSGCDAYTFVNGSPVTSSVECRLYSGFQAIGPSSLVGARTFAMKIADVDECSSSPCQNGGTCTDQVNGYLCQCAPGYAGLQCQTDVNECSSNPCPNGGTCTDQVNGYQCQCAPGYAGLQCQTDVDECSCNPCQNGGSCTDQVNSYLCQCTPGYTGLQCQTDVDECSCNPCQNGGSCTDQVNGYLCQCTPGYTGLQCQTDVDECSSSPCQNGGTCTDQVNGYLCQCAPGYEGLQCQTDVDECLSSPCQNGGTCLDQVNGYLCQCATGDEGLQCQTPWLNKACAQTSDCPGSLVTCYGGQCLCEAYAYFSDGTNVCVLSCAQSDLRSTFLVYTDMDTTGVPYIAEYEENDVGQCQAGCVASSNCQAIIHDLGVGSDDSCWHISSFGDGTTHDSTGWHLYKRTCA